MRCRSVSLSCKGKINHLIRLPEELKKLIGQGLSFSDCVRAFAADDGDPFVAEARNKANDQLEIDATAVTSVGDDGAWVSAWVWVGNAEAGIEEEP